MDTQPATTISDQPADGEPRVSERVIRIWLDTSWVIHAIKDREGRLRQHYVHRYDRDLIELLKLLKEKGLTPQIAISHRLLNEITGIKDPELFLSSWPERSQFFREEHACQRLNLSQRDIIPLRNLLLDLAAAITSDPAVAQAETIKPIVFVNTSACQKKFRRAVLDLDDKVAAICDPAALPYFMAGTLNTDRATPPTQAFARACNEHRIMKLGCAHYAGQSTLAPLCAMETTTSGIVSPANPLAVIASDPLFHMVAADWVRMPNPENNGEFSMQSGIKRSWVKANIMLSTDDIEGNQNYFYWLGSRAMEDKLAGVLHPDKMSAFIESIRRNSNQPLRYSGIVGRDAHLTRILQYISPDMEITYGPLHALRATSAAGSLPGH